MTDLMQEPRRLWICDDHDGIWPVPVASVVMANSEDDARALLTSALVEAGMPPQKPFTLVELNISIPFARVISNGDY